MRCTMHPHGPVEQRSARLPVTEKVAGSNPVRSAKIKALSKDGAFILVDEPGKVATSGTRLVRATESKTLV